MNHSKVLLGIFVVVAVLQLAAPASLIWRYEYTLRTGQAYKFRTAPVDPYDAFRGRYVALQFAQTSVPVREKQVLTRGQRVYVLIAQDADGFARLQEATTALPPSGDYLYVPIRWLHPDNNTVDLILPFDRFYMEETIAPQAEQAYRQRSRQQQAYVLVRVRGGRGVIENLFLDHTPIADVVRGLAPRP